MANNPFADLVGTGTPQQNTRPDYSTLFGAPKKKKKGFWEDQISTGGGIAGALAGGAAGTAILPGVGTIIGALLGGAAGGGGGQVLENAVTGEKNLGKDVASEAILNGIFGAGPLRAGSLAVRGASALAKGAGKEGLVRAGEKALVDRPVRNALGKAFTGAGDNMAVRSVGATPSQLTNFQKKFGEDIVPVLTRNNLVGRGVEDVTKARSVLDKQFGELVKGAGDVTKTDLSKAFEKAYTPLLKSASLDKQASGKAVKAQADVILKKIKAGKVAASDLNSIKSEFDSLVNYTAKAADPAKYGVNKKIADVLREAVHNAPGANGLKDTGMEISKLRSLEDILMAQGNRGRGSNPLGITDAIGAGSGGAVFGIPGAVVGATVTRAANSPVAKRLATKGLEGAGSKLSAKSTIEQAMGIKPVATRVGAAGAIGSAGQLSDGMNQDMSTNMSATSADSMMPPMNSNMGELYQNPQDMSMQEPSIGGFSKSQIEQAMAMAIMNGDGKAASELKSLYDLLPAASSSKLNSTQLQQANNAQSGLQSLGTIASILQQNPDIAKLAALPGGSFTQSITGTGEYAAAINNATDVIGRLRSGGAINKDEEARFRALLPAAFDDQATVQYKLGALANLFQQFANPQAAQPDYQTQQFAQ